MKKASKILSVILSLALLAGFAAVLVTAEDQANGITATVGKVTGAKGDQVTVPVQISENSNVVSFTGSITFDSTKLKVVQHEYNDQQVYVSSDIWEGELASNESPAGTLLIAGAKNETGYTGGGNLFVVTFEVLEDLTEITPVNVDFTVFEVNADGEDKVAEVTVVAGGVEPETGDSSDTSETETTTTTSAPPVEGVQVTVGEVAGEVGQTVTLPVEISADSNLVSFTGVISYDPAQLEPVGSEDEYASSDVFEGELSSYVVEPGTLRVAGAKGQAGVTPPGTCWRSPSRFWTGSRAKRP